MGLKEDREKAKAGSGSAIIDPNCALLKGFPLLAENLNGYAGEGGKWVKGVSFSLYMEAGQLKVCLSDKMTNKITFTLLDPFLTIPEALEAWLAEEAKEWRNNRGNRA